MNKGNRMRHQLDNGVELFAFTSETGTNFSGSSTGEHFIGPSSDDRITAHWVGYVAAAERAYANERWISRY